MSTPILAEHYFVDDLIVRPRRMRIRLGCPMQSSPRTALAKITA